MSPHFSPFIPGSCLLDGERLRRLRASCTVPCNHHGLICHSPSPLHPLCVGTSINPHLPPLLFLPRPPLFPPSSTSTSTMWVLLSLSLKLDWSCPLTILSICLATVYALCLFLCLFYQFRLLRLPCHQRQSQRLFLHLSITQCLLRALYFTLWPIFIANASPPSTSTASTDPSSSSSAFHHCNIFVEGENESLLLLLLGSLPSALFLSAFTCHVLTFSRIYHSVLAPSVLKYRLVLLLMAAVNLTTYTSLLLLYLTTAHYSPHSSLSSPTSPPSSHSLSDIAESLYLYALSCSTLLLASSFAFYGVKLYMGVRGSSSSSHSSHLPPSASFSSVEGNGPFQSSHGGAGLISPFLTPSSSLSSLTTPPTPSLPHHPLLKLAVVSSLCFLCFLVRVILLPVLSHYQDGELSFPLLLLYLCLSEVLPLLLVLYLFDPVREGRGLMGVEAGKGEGGEGVGYDEGVEEEEWVIDGEGETLALGWEEERSERPAMGSMGEGVWGMLGDGLSTSLGGMSVGSGMGSVGRGDAGMATLSPRELDRRRAKTGTSYQEAFRSDLKALIADD